MKKAGRGFIPFKISSHQTLISARDKILKKKAIQKAYLRYVLSHKVLLAESFKKLERKQACYLGILLIIAV